MTVREGRPAPGTPCWHDLMSPDVEAAARFYTDLFGWAYDASGAEYGFYHMARVGGRPAAGIGQMPEGAGMPSAWTVYFATDDVHATAEHAAALGATVTMPPMEVPAMGWMAIVLDPAGAAFGLWQGTGHLGTGIEDVHGTTTWRDLHTPDIEAARAFYTELLGADAQPLEAGGTPTYGLAKDGRNIGGIVRAPSGADAAPPTWMTTFEVADLEAATALCTSGDGKVVQPPFDTPSGRMAVVSDPFGAVFGLNQRSA